VERQALRIFVSLAHPATASKLFVKLQLIQSRKQQCHYFTPNSKLGLITLSGMRKQQKLSG